MRKPSFGAPALPDLRKPLPNKLAGRGPELKRNPTKGGKRGKGFQKGETGNPNGRPPSARTLVQQAKLRIMARTGMMPLDFLTAVYRNELYNDYEQYVAEDGKTLYWAPKPGRGGEPPKRIWVDVNQRLSAAIAAAPYVHKRQPVGIELEGKAAMAVTAEKLRKLSTQELEDLLALMDKLGVDLDVGASGPGVTVDEEGRVLPPA